VANLTVTLTYEIAGVVREVGRVVITNASYGNSGMRVVLHEEYFPERSLVVHGQAAPPWWGFLARLLATPGVAPAAVPGPAPRRRKTMPAAVEPTPGWEAAPAPDHMFYCPQGHVIAALPQAGEPYDCPTCAGVPPTLAQRAMRRRLAAGTAARWRARRAAERAEPEP
jgi:hypothetical protein